MKLRITRVAAKFIHDERSKIVMGSMRILRRQKMTTHSLAPSYQVGLGLRFLR